MRIRVLGQHVPVSIAVLAFTEGALAFLALYAAVYIRVEIPIARLRTLGVELGPLWPRGLVFAAIVIVCLLAFGLYSGRQRAQLTGVFLRVGAALIVAWGVLAAIQ